MTNTNRANHGDKENKDTRIAHQLRQARRREQRKVVKTDEQNRLRS